MRLQLGTIIASGAVLFAEAREYSYVDAFFEYERPEVPPELSYEYHKCTSVVFWRTRIADWETTEDLVKAILMEHRGRVGVAVRTVPDVAQRAYFLRRRFPPGGVPVFWRASHSRAVFSVTAGPS